MDNKVHTLPTKWDEQYIYEYRNKHVMATLPNNYGKLDTWDARNSRWIATALR